MEFRRQLKRSSRREARVAREQAENAGKERQQAIQDAIAAAREEGFPTDVEEKEAYFMNEVGEGEKMCQDGEFLRPRTSALERRELGGTREGYRDEAAVACEDGLRWLEGSRGGNRGRGA